MSEKVKYSDLIKTISTSTGHPQSSITSVVEGLVSGLESVLKEGKSVTIPKLGTFDARKTKEREGRNPATGATITIPAGKKVGFKPATSLKEEVKNS